MEARALRALGKCSTHRAPSPNISKEQVFSLSYLPRGFLDVEKTSKHIHAAEQTREP